MDTKEAIKKLRCPNCQSGVVLYKEEAKFLHCQWCGQKLNWGEEDDR